jgi:hypothetical protein
LAKLPPQILAGKQHFTTKTAISVPPAVKTPKKSMFFADGALLL